MQVVFVFLVLFLCLQAQDSHIAPSQTPKQAAPTIQQEYDSITSAPPTETKYFNFKELFARLRLFEPFYMLPVAYNFAPMYDDKDLQRVDFKTQVSFRLELFADKICQYCDVSFDYTQRIYFQIYNHAQSAPLRDFDLSPRLSFNYKKPLAIKGGKGGYFNWFSFGYLHISNGEKDERNLNDIRQHQAPWNNDFIRSKSFDRLFAETNYRYKNFNATLRIWYITALLATDGRRTNGDIQDYYGYGDLKLSYRYKDNLFEFYINNIFNNYFDKNYWTHWKGRMELGYSYGITKTFAIYAQYILGYGDSLYEYSVPINRLGIGLRLRDF